MTDQIYSGKLGDLLLRFELHGRVQYDHADDHVRGDVLIHVLNEFQGSRFSISNDSVDASLLVDVRQLNALHRRLVIALRDDLAAGEAVSSLGEAIGEPEVAGEQQDRQLSPPGLLASRHGPEPGQSLWRRRGERRRFLG